MPPWIEKQQEVVATASKFRSRLRNDWKRHAARTISSRGGSLESQISKAQDYARAEAIVNPSLKKQETLNAVDSAGHVSQISLSGQLQPPKDGEAASTVKITVTEGSIASMSINPSIPDSQLGTTPAAESSVQATGSVEQTASDNNESSDTGTVIVFRDPHWEETERSYHQLAIENLNSLTRTYNLMAPNLAKKPYFSLDRELRACFADVAPQVADEILQRATAPKVKIEVVPHREGSVLEKIAGGSARVYDDRRQPYGFKEFWRDVFGKKEAA